MVDGTFIDSDDVTAMLTQTDTVVEGNWSSPMPAILVEFGAPADVNLSGSRDGDGDGHDGGALLRIPRHRGVQAVLRRGLRALRVDIVRSRQRRWTGRGRPTPRVSRRVVDSGTLTLTR